MTKKTPYVERLSVGLTAEMVREVERLSRYRASRGQPYHKADIGRAALQFFIDHQDNIPGTRAALTRKLEGRMDTLDSRLTQVETALTRQSELLEQLVAFFRRKREGG